MGDGASRESASPSDIAITGDVKGGMVNIGGTQDIHGNVHIGDTHVTSMPRGLRLYSLGVLVVMLMIAGAVILLVPSDTWNALKAAIGISEYSPATEGELLIIVAEFEKLDENPLNPAALFNRTLNEAFETVQRDYDVPLRVARTATVIKSMDEAKALSDKVNATLVIWGSVDSAGLDTFFSVNPRWGKIIGQTVEETQFTAQANLDEVGIRIRNAIEPQYMVNFIVGQILYNDKQYDKALPFFEKAIDLVKSESETVQHNMALAAVYFDVGYIQQTIKKDEEAALSLYTDAINLEPNGSYAVIAYNNRGNAYYSTGDYDQAIADYTQAIVLKSDYALVYSNRGLAYSDMGDYQRAIVDFDKALNLKSDDALAYYSRGLAYYNTGDYEQAIADYTQAIALKSDYVQAYTNRGVTDFYLWHRSGEQHYLDAALDNFNQIIRLDENSSIGFSNLCLVYLFMDQYKDALTFCNKAIALILPSEDYSYTFRHIVRGFVFIALNQLADAESDFTAAKTYKPDNVFALRGIADAYYALKAYSEALDAYHTYIGLMEKTDTHVILLIQQRVKELEAMATPTPGS